jgi:tripartite-type tricarboxylate transporter receptor subunit TctC
MITVQQPVFRHLTVLAAQIRDGKVKGLQVASGERSPQLPELPEVPTAAETGVADYVIGSWIGLVAPKGTPPGIVARLDAEAVRIGALPDVRARLEAQGLSVSTSTPDAFAATIRADYDRWGKVVSNAGIKAF